VKNKIWALNYFAVEYGIICFEKKDSVKIVSSFFYVDNLITTLSKESYSCKAKHFKYLPLPKLGYDCKTKKGSGLY